MASKAQVRGYLLEEIILALLSRSGYRPVSSAGFDPTLKGAFPTLRVRGRGEEHQIDAVADVVVGQPFVNPQRLLLEAKAYESIVGIDKVRNAVGVLADVSQFFYGADNRHRSAWRHHYRYALFSLSGFSPEAQRYGFAHDIALVPLEGLGPFRRIGETLKRATEGLET